MWKSSFSPYFSDYFKRKVYKYICTVCIPHLNTRILWLFMQFVTSVAERIVIEFSTPGTFISHQKCITCHLTITSSSMVHHYAIPMFLNWSVPNLFFFPFILLFRSVGLVHFISPHVIKICSLNGQDWIIFIFMLRGHFILFYLR